ncbi:MAG: helix-turn-helix domain-containing protein [Pseudomonadota bacterium]
MKRRDLADAYCSIARAGAVLQDAWSFLILRELFLGNGSFDGLRRQTGMSPRSLSLRLKALQGDDIVIRRDAPGYRLTEKGIELWPLLVLLKQWGDKWAGPWGQEGAPVAVRHKDCGAILELETICRACGEPVTARDAVAQPNRTFAALRSERAAAPRDATGDSRP